MHHRGVRYRTLFPYKPDPRPTFLRHTQRSRIQKLGLFWGPQKILRASEAGKKKWPKLHHFLGKNKLRRNFIWEKLIEFFVFNEISKNLIFFPITCQNFYLCILKNKIFLTSEALKIFWGSQKRPNFWILDLCVCLKKVSLGATVLKILSCIYWAADIPRIRSSTSCVCRYQILVHFS